MILETSLQSIGEIKNESLVVVERSPKIAFLISNRGLDI